MTAGGGRMVATDATLVFQIINTLIIVGLIGLPIWLILSITKKNKEIQSLKDRLDQLEKKAFNKKNLD